jgi:hypothetical protein
MNMPAVIDHAAPATTPMEMIDRAVASGASIDVLERLMSLQERWEANQGRRAFDAAIAAAKAEIPIINKNRTVDFTSAKGRTNYRHEDMAEIAKTVDPILSRYGLSYRYRTAQDGKAVTVTCIVSHRDGYSEETTLSTGIDESGNKNATQGIGSAVTYLQRYTLKAALGLAASTDDDARKAEPAKATVEMMTASDYQQLQARVAAQGDDADKVEAFLCQKHGVETLHELTKPQWIASMAMLAKREAASKGATNATS